MTVGVQADRLYVGDTLVWDAPAVARGVPDAVAFNCNNGSASAISLSWGPVWAQAGDVLVMAVLHRHALTVPDGWTLHATADSPGSPQTTPETPPQSTSILTRRFAATGSVSGTVRQAAYGRMQVGIVNMRGVSEVVSRPDLTAVISKSHMEVTVPGKARPGVVMWAVSCSHWSASMGPQRPYISRAVMPWSASPGMWAPEWIPDGDHSNNSRLGMFLDISDPGPRKFNSGLPIDDVVPIVAVELVGTPGGSAGGAWWTTDDPSSAPVGARVGDFVLDVTDGTVYKVVS